MSAAETTSQAATNGSGHAKPSPVRPALCTHVKTDGSTCGSPAVKGTDFCFHHSAVKTAIGKAAAASKAANGGFAPIPFVFPEDRASMQINFFLLLQAFNEGRIDLRTFNSMQRLLCSMARNLGKTGSLMEPASEEAGKDEAGGSKASKGDALTSQSRDVEHPAVSGEPTNEETAAALKIIAEANTAGPDIGSLHMPRQSKLNVNYQWAAGR